MKRPNGPGSFKALGAAFVIASDAAENLKSFSKDATELASNGKRIYQQVLVIMEFL